MKIKIFSEWKSLLLNDNIFLKYSLSFSNEWNSKITRKKKKIERKWNIHLYFIFNNTIIRILVNDINITFNYLLFI